MRAVRELTKAWICKDWLGMSRWLTEDVVEIGPDFEVPLVGKKVFARKYQEYLSSELKVVSYRILRPQIVPLTKRLAAVYFSYRMKTRVKQVVESSEGKESILLEKGPSGWSVRFIHWHRDPDRSGSASAGEGKGLL